MEFRALTLDPNGVRTAVGFKVKASGFMGLRT